MFSNASGFIINQATFIENGMDALPLLSQYVAQGATHDSYAQDDAPKCHPDTRIQLLSDINEWMLEPNKETGILYLHGPAGAGKSCIARSACAQAFPPGYLRASFFFWRGSHERNNITKLFTTIAYQLAMLNDDLAGFILSAIQRNPRIVSDAPVRRQFRKLIFEPCCRLQVSQPGQQLKGAIIIDGLDECIDKEAQMLIIKLLGKMVNWERFPLGIFITSRPEIHLKEAWDAEQIAPLTQFISLSGIPNTSDDIRTVFESGFSRILNNRRFISALQYVARPWPNRGDVTTLVERSSGQFIYAATVLKFVSSRSHNPDAQLQIVLGLKNSNTSPLADLDELYHEILSRADDPTRTIKVLAFILTIMDIDWRNVEFGRDISLPILQEINGDLNKLLLIVDQLIFVPTGEALLALHDLASLIDLDTGLQPNSLGDTEFTFYHKSFKDFLFTRDRSKEYYIDIQETHAEIVQSCLKILYLPKYETAEHHVGWLYSYFLWHIHVCASDRREEIHNFAEPVQRFMGSQLYFNNLHLQEAFQILELHETIDSITEVANALTGRLQPPSIAALVQIRSKLWILPTKNSSSREYPSFKESLIYNPLLLAHLKSFKMDWFAVKRLLALHAIVPLDELSESGLYRVGTIHELEFKFPGIRKDINMLLPWNDSDVILGCLCSEIFSFTPEDIAEAYAYIVNISIPGPVLSKSQESQYAALLEIWALRLHYIRPEPAATSLFLATLKSAARDVHDKPALNRSLTHKVEVYLLTWLESLPSPPQDIINVWRKAFAKARSDCYGRYFCRPSWKCPTDSCPERR